MQQQRGFTLIELIIVIVILGILAVTAAPRFIDLQSDAQKSTLEGVKGALQGASQLVYAKSAIAGKQSAEAEKVTISGSTVAVAYGYPHAGELAAITGNEDAIKNASNFVDLDDTALSIVKETSTTATTMYVVFEGKTVSDGCYIQYVNAVSAGASPTITLVDKGC